MKLTLRKVITFPEIEMGQYVVILETCKKFWNWFMWLTVTLIKKNSIFPYISHNILPYIYIYKSSYQVKLKSGNLLTIPLCSNLLDWIFKILVLLRLMGLKLECIMSQNGHKLCIQCCKIFKVCLTILGHSLKG